MSRRSIILASSPVIGPLTMGRLAAAFRKRGVDVATPAAPFDPDEFAETVAAAVDPGHSLLAGFSAAGPRLFAVADRRRAAGVLFVDGRLPADGVAPAAEPAFAELLARLPVDEHGMLPPWPTWWPDDVLVELCPDAVLRQQFVAECPPVPRAVYDRPLLAPAYDGACGYLAFGDGYADQRRLAAARGWPTRTLPHRHLAPLVAPDDVADAIVDVAERMGVW